jgi:membrane protein DedA with SNARE-associated domain
VESFIQSLQSFDPALVCLALFAVAFLENIFPPSPSDMAIVFGGTLVGIGRIGFPEALLSATAGSTLGFVAMYAIGKWFGRNILEQRKIRFLPLDSVHKVESWFVKYGYWIIIANRFLAGTRAVVSFFAGMSGLKLPVTTLLCLLSALIWNSLLITGGYLLGNNWERIGFYISTYSQVVTGLVVLIVIIFVARYFAKSSRKAS